MVVKKLFLKAVVQCKSSVARPALVRSGLGSHVSSSLQSEPPPLLLLSAGAQTFGQQYFSLEILFLFLIYLENTILSRSRSCCQLPLKVLGNNISRSKICSKFIFVSYIFEQLNSDNCDICDNSMHKKQN